MKKARTIFVPLIRDGSTLKTGKAQTAFGRPGDDLATICQTTLGVIAMSLITPFPYCYGKFEVEYIPGKGLCVDVTHYGSDLSQAGMKRLRRKIEQLNQHRLHFPSSHATNSGHEFPRVKFVIIIG